MTPKIEGHRAATDGRGYSMNPYPADSEDGEAWLQGWHAAHHDRRCRHNAALNLTYAPRLRRSHGESA